MKYAPLIEDPMPMTNLAVTRETPQGSHEIKELHWLAHVPVPLFAVVMGVTGLGLAWRKGHEVLGLPAEVGEAVLALGGLFFGLIFLLYLSKALRHPAEFKAEFNHPIRSNFVAAISISILLLATAIAPYAAEGALLPWNLGPFPGAREIAVGLWSVGAAAQLLITLRLVGRWIFHAQEINHSNPAWFIPIVGNVLVPLAGVRLGFVDTSWFFFSVGLIFWILLFTIVFYRIVFHKQLPPKLVPTLFIFVPPPAVGMLSYLALTGGEMDVLARLLANFTLFLVLLLLSLGHRFVKVPFAVSWWAFTFPLDAAAVATLVHAEKTGSELTAWIGGGLVGIATAVVALVLVRTFVALARGQLFVPE